LVQLSSWEVDTKGADEGDVDNDFNPKAKQGKKTTRRKPWNNPQAEIVRAEMHTLTEHHEHLLTASFDLSYLGSGGGSEPFSSKVHADFAFGDDFLNPPSDGSLDLEGLGDELEKELGWGQSPSGNMGLSVLSLCSRR
jgi:hypothetical protein